MNIKSNNTKFLIEPADLANFIGINKADAYVSIDKQTLSFSVSGLTEEIVNEKWAEEVVDGRKFRKIKKQILRSFGDHILEEYKTTNKIYEELNSDFINVSGISDVMKNAISNDMNIILYGRGGFGKSEMMGKLFNRPELRDRVFIQSLSEATTEEDLFGGIRMKKFMDTGEKEYLVENSFANSEIVIFEEIFDAPARVLAALKDTLTSKEIRNGNQRFPIKTKIIIGLTNKTYDEIIEDDSTEALTQRFPISYKMEYDITKIEAASLIFKRYKDYDLQKAAAIVDTLSSMKAVSPRKILEVAKYIKDISIRKNKVYAEHITNNSITPVIDYLKHKVDIDFNDVIFAELVKADKNIRIENAIDYDCLIDTAKNVMALIPDDTLVDEKSNRVREKIKEILVIIDKIAA